jgi:hypothetical protein
MNRLEKIINNFFLFLNEVFEIDKLNQDEYPNKNYIILENENGKEEVIYFG